MSLDVYGEERGLVDKCISGIRVVVWVEDLIVILVLAGLTWCPRYTIVKSD
jgi:hypothetical protein